MTLDCFVACAPRNDELRQINPSGKSLLIFRNRVKPKYEKYSAFAVGQISASTAAVSRPHEGRIAIVTARWARDAMDAAASGAFFAPDENADAYGEVVWSWRPLLASSRRSYPPMTVTNKNSLTGESTKEAVKTVARGKPG